MAVITFPTALESYVAQQAIGQRRFDTFDTSDVTGATDTVVGVPRWTMDLQAHAGMELPIAGQWDALMLQLRGGVNHLAMHDLLRPLPFGTARGTGLTTSGTTALGATSVSLLGARAHPNLLRFSRDLRNTAEAGATRPWTQFQDADAGVALVSTTLPDGTTGNASRLQLSSTGAAQRQVQQAAALAPDNTIICASAFLKADQVQAVVVFGASKTPRFPFARYRVDTGVLISAGTDTGEALAGHGIINAGGGWWRLWWAWNTRSGAAQASPIIGLITTAGLNYSGAVNDGLLVWGVQVEIGTEPTTYVAAPTLTPGDWLQIGSGVGSHFAKVVEAATLSDAEAAVAVTFEPPTRQSYTGGTAVIIEKARGHFKRASSSAGWANVPGALMSGGHGLELVEQWS